MIHVCENEEFHFHKRVNLHSCKYNNIILTRKIILYDDSCL